ncbi:MAG: hypothetical protein RLZZ628_2143 [Bacteroidota bacterium]|jgi:hypothetical protein
MIFFTFQKTVTWSLFLTLLFLSKANAITPFKYVGKLVEPGDTMIIDALHATQSHDTFNIPVYANVPMLGVDCVLAYYSSSMEIISVKSARADVILVSNISTSPRVCRIGAYTPGANGVEANKVLYYIKVKTACPLIGYFGNVYMGLNSGITPTKVLSACTAPTVTLNTEPSTISEHLGTQKITATLSAPTTEIVTLTLRKAGTAIEGVDYTLDSNTITIPAGSTTGSVTLTAIDNVKNQPDKTVIIDIIDASNASRNGFKQTITIADDDPLPTVLLTTNVDSIAEAGGSATLTATLSHPYSEIVTLTLSRGGTTTYKTSPDAIVVIDYALSSTKITIPAGSTKGSVTITLYDDIIYEKDETILIDIETVTNGINNGVQQKTLTILNDDPIPTVTLVADAPTIKEKNESVYLSTRLSNPSEIPITVTLTTSGTATYAIDYSLESLTTTVQPYHTSAGVLLTTINDAIHESDETVIIDIETVTTGIERGVQRETITIIDDDPLPTVALSTNVASIAEAGGTALLTATLSAAFSETVTINLIPSGTATNRIDYTLSSTIITIPAGSTTGSVTLTALEDAIHDANETIILSLGNIINGTQGTPAQQTITIIDNYPVPTVTLSANATIIAEAGGKAILTATLSAVSSEMVTITFAQSGTATDVTDYTLSNTTLTIPAGSISGSVTLTAVNDALHEANETIIIDIATVANGTESGVQQKTITIMDDDLLPTVTFSVNPNTLFEGGVATITATLSNTYTEVVTVTFATSGTATNGSDYTLSNTTLTIPVGSTSGSITLTTIDDKMYEDSETVTLDIETVTNGTESGVQQKIVIINDNDPYPTLTFSVDTTRIPETGGKAILTATLSNPSSQTVVVALSPIGSATLGTDYTLSNSVITIPSGSKSATVTLTAIHDVLYEGNENITINLASVTNASANGVQSKSITIIDDDPMPTVTLTANPTSIAEAGGIAILTATLSAVSSQEVTIFLTASGTATRTTDYIVNTTLKIPAGSTSGSATLTAVNDALHETNETIIIDIETVINGTENGVQQKTITITDDDPIPTVTLSTNVTSIAEAGGKAILTATLSAASSQEVTILFATSGTATYTTDYTFNTTLVIPAGSISGSVPLTAVNDALHETNETIIIDIETVINGTENGVQQKTITIIDNDRVSIQTNQQDFSIKIYPSLVEDNLTIATEADKITDLQIVDLNGVVVRAVQNLVINGSLNLNVSDLPNAVYIIRARNNEGYLLTTKIFKM